MSHCLLDIFSYPSEFWIGRPYQKIGATQSTTLLPCIKPNLKSLPNFFNVIYFVHGDSEPLPPQVVSMQLVKFLLAFSSNTISDYSNKSHLFGFF